MKTIAVVVFILLAAFSTTRSEDFSITVGGSDGILPCAKEQQVNIGLAISGGGARGLATIGILRAFEEKGIHISAITGSSMGGIMGGLYACGYSAEDLTTLVDKLQFDSLFNNAPARKTMFLTQRAQRERHLFSLRFDGWRPVIPTGLTKGQRLTTLLTELTTPAVYRANGRFTDLPIPFKTVTTDIENGQSLVLDSGSLANAMRATMAFPLAFTPVLDNGHQLMDGGMLVPIPVDLVKPMLSPGAYVVAINTASSLLPGDKLTTPIDIANQVTTIMTADKLKRQLEHADYVISPDLRQFQSTDFDEKEKIIDIGYHAGLSAADSIIAACKNRVGSTRLLVSKVYGSNTDPVTLQEVAVRLGDGLTTGHDLTRILQDVACRHQLFLLKADLSSSDTSSVYTMKIATIPVLYGDSLKISIEGNVIYSDSELISRMALEFDKITPERLRRAEDRLLNMYHVNDMDLAEIVSTSINPDSNLLAITIDEGIISRIDVTDNVRTRDWFVRSHFPLKRGEPYSSALAMRGLENIYGTDLFNRVTLGVERSRHGTIVKIGVGEKYYRQVRVGWHWNETYKSEQFLQLLDDNLMGMGLELLFHAQYAPDHQKYYASLQADRIWSTYLTAKASIFHTRLNRFIYDGTSAQIGKLKERRRGAQLQVGQQIARLGAVTAAITAERVEYDRTVHNFSTYFNLVRLQLSSLVESFDRTPFTVTGNRSEIDLQLTNDYLGSDVDYTRLWASFEQFIPLAADLNFHPVFDIGLSASGLPPTEQFYLGGSRSFYGYQTNQLPGDNLLHFSYAFRLHLPLNLYVSVRHDIGEVYNRTDEIKLNNLRNGFGVKLAVDTPMGPFSISHGIAEGDNEETYINCGFEF